MSTYAINTFVSIHIDRGTARIGQVVELLSLKKKGQVVELLKAETAMGVELTIKNVCYSCLAWSQH